MANWIIIGGSQGPVINPPGGGTPADDDPPDGLAEKATFFAGFGSPILPGQDYGARHIVARSSAPTHLYAHVTNPSPSGPFIFDVLLSMDGGVTWNTCLGTPISIVSTDVVVSTDFVAGTTFAAGNLLRLDIKTAGISSGFQCVLAMQGATAPGWDRATFVFGLNVNPPVGRDFGGYYLVSRATMPTRVMIHLRVPPGDDVALDLHVWRDGNWYSFLTTPITVAAGFVGVITSEEFQPNTTFTPGQLIRPYLVAGSAASGMGYNVVLSLGVL